MGSRAKASSPECTPPRGGVGIADELRLLSKIGSKHPASRRRATAAHFCAAVHHMRRDTAWPMRGALPMILPRPSHRKPRSSHHQIWSYHYIPMAYSLFMGGLGGLEGLSYVLSRTCAHVRACMLYGTSSKPFQPSQSRRKPPFLLPTIFPRPSQLGRLRVCHPASRPGRAAAEAREGCPTRCRGGRAQSHHR